jgi:hypothetical protein
VSTFRNESIADKIVPGIDAREKIELTTRLPYSLKGIFAAWIEEERILGSGTIIELNLVLTCAQNVYKKDVLLSWYEW